LTGLLPHSHGVWSNGPYRLEPEYPTLAESFRRAGFRTAAVVASFVLSRSFGLAEGYQFFDDSTPEAADRDPEKTADQVVEAAREWLDRSAGTPFFLWLHFYDPHTPYSAPEPFRGRFAHRPYLGEVAFVDGQVGRLLSHLETSGQLESTLIVVVSDHGEGLGEHSEDTHGYFLYDNTVRVPLLLKGPGIPTGMVVRSQVTLADLAPTLLEAFELPAAQGHLDGRSFWSELQAGSVEERPALIENRAIQHQYGWAPLAGIRADGWKWIRAPEPELYNLAVDSAESRNLASSEPERAREMEQRRRQLLPQEPQPRPTGGLSPEAEEKLRALGYLAGGGSRGPSANGGPDPKDVASVIADIEALTRARRTDGSEQTRSRVESVLQVDPTNLFALRVKGQQLVDEGRFPEAIEILGEIVEGHETHPEALAFLAMAYQGAGRIREAVSWFTKATTPPWIYWPALESLARLAGRHPSELSRDSLLNRLDGLRPGSAGERLSVARALAILSEFERAEERFEGALEADPQLAEARVGLAQMQAVQGRTREALATLSGVEPPTVESVFVTGTTLWGEGEREGACDRFRRVMTLDPRNVNLLLGLGRYLEGCGEPALATEAFQRVLTRQSGHPGAVEALRRLSRQGAM
jgi:arylsulfatase A-like enzyme/Flp pilus assembly protein TadD